jgi:hypothetical protein
MTQQIVFILAILLLTFQFTLQSLPVVKCSETNALEFDAPEEILESEIFDVTLVEKDCSTSLVCKLDCEKILPKNNQNCFTQNLYVNLTSPDGRGKSLYEKVCSSKRGLRTLGQNSENLVYSIGSQLYRKFVEKETGITRQEFLEKEYPLVYNEFPEIMTNYVDDESIENLPTKVKKSVNDFYKNLNKQYVDFATDEVGKTYKNGKALKALSEYVDSFRGVIKLCDQNLSGLPESQIKSTVSATVKENLENWIKNTAKGGSWGSYKYENLNRNEKEEFDNLTGKLNGEFIDIVVKDYNNDISVNRSFCYCSSFISFLVEAHKGNGKINHQVANHVEFNQVRKLTHTLKDICREKCK